MILQGRDYRIAMGVLAVASALILSGCDGGAHYVSPSGSAQAGPAAITRSIGATLHAARGAAGIEKVLYSFKGGADGNFPVAGLINVGGTLYGTTVQGGGPECNCGTVFEISTSGNESVLHRFTRPDGYEPYGELLDVDGTLYSTTFEGGASPCRGPGCGTIFSLTTSGEATLLHSFAGPTTDGSKSSAGLINVAGTLYGTTVSGGTGSCPRGCGTVFKITQAGQESVLHYFTTHGADGWGPDAGLVNVGGTLYGTTYAGGGTGCYNGLGCGTVFKITTSGEESVIHRFGGARDGVAPVAGLLPVDGVLYGTTLAGGEGRCTYGQFYVGCGTVFKITTPGVESVVHSFAGGSDGNNPEAGLIDVDGTLYGTTEIGGGTGCITAYSIGCGTVFKVSPAGKESVVHNFTGPPADGKYPYAGLLGIDGTLYGTTSGGGRGCDGPGCGTVFSIEL